MSASSLRSFTRRLGRGLAVAAVLGIAVLAWTVSEPLPEPAPTLSEAEQSASDGWGSEVLRAIHEHVPSPIARANACGLGASSCFKCHNGQRAKAPGHDPAASPWHVDHKTVNNSCAGCHGGNPRIIKQNIAHRGMIGDPRTTPEKSCVSCHAGADAGELVKAYQALTGGGN